MFRELDQRHSDGLTVTLEWDATTGHVRVRCEDRRSPEESFSYLVDPTDARLAFLHPFALRPSCQEHKSPVTSPGTAHDAASDRWRRQRSEAEANEPGDYT
jgi:hypothetical protein